MELPPSLAPWQEFLASLPTEVAISLGPLIQRLDLAIGPLSSGTLAGDGEPDGINGIARRGSYERLLISEWLLAEELPEEFTRRALTGEHSFLKLARLAPSATRNSTALFDAGPDQWGAPRIVHLAALIVLARRAAAAGATFRWGLLQDPERSVCQSVDANALRLFLADRQLAPVTPDDLDGWRAAWPELMGTGDAWLVGGSRVARWDGGRSATVSIEDPLEPEEQRLDATVTVRGRASRTVALALPDTRTCVRLLRDPYATAVAAPQRAGGFCAPCSNLVFSATGSKLFARSSTGGIVAFPIPNSARAGAGRPRHHLAKASGTIVAVGRYFKSTILLIAGEDANSLTLEFVGGSQRLRGGEVKLQAGNFSVEAGCPLSPIVSVGRNEDTEFFAFVNGSLIQIGNVNLPGMFGTVMATQAAAFAPVRGGVAWTDHRKGGVYLAALHDRKERTRQFLEEPGKRAYFGFGGAEEDPEFGLVASEKGDGIWYVHDRGGVRQMAPPTGSSVVGVVAAPGREQHPALIVLEPDGRNITVLSRGWSQPLPPAPAEILEVAVSPVAPIIGYYTVEGEVFVYSLTEDTVIYRFKSAGAVP